MKINCIGCGHAFDLGNAYDDYEGLVRCNTCANLLFVRTHEGNVRGVMPGEMYLQMQQQQPLPQQSPQPRAAPTLTSEAAPPRPMVATQPPLSESRQAA